MNRMTHLGAGGRRLLVACASVSLITGGSWAQTPPATDAPKRQPDHAAPDGDRPAARPDAPNQQTPPQQAPPTKAETDRMSLVLRLPPANPAGFVGDPYPLDTCIVTGEPLGDHPVVLVLKNQTNGLEEGRQLKFSSEEAKTKFLARSRDYLAELDERIIAKFAGLYPLDRDVVEIDQKLTERYEFVFGNRCYVVGRAKNIDNFVKQSGRYVKQFDKMLVSKQRGSYPLDTSIVSGKKLPEKPYDVIVGYRLVRLVDEVEAKTFFESPEKYLATLPMLKGKGEADGASREGTSPPKRGDGGDRAPSR